MLASQARPAHSVASRCLLVAVQLAAVCVCIAVMPAAAKAAPRIESVQVGWAGHAKAGRWARVTCEFQSLLQGSVQLSVTTVDPDGNPVEYVSDYVTVPGNGTLTLSTLVRFGRMDAGLRIALRDKATQTVLLNRNAAQLDSGQIEFEPLDRLSVRHVLVCGPADGFARLTELQTAAASQANDGAPAPSREALKVAQLDGPQQLPLHPLDLDAVNVVVMARNFSVSNDQSEALRQWVLGGGHLVIAAGDCIQQFQQSVLSEWVEVEATDEELSVRELSGIETLAGGQARLALGRSVSIPQLIAEDGRVLVPGPDGPVIVRLAVGTGFVTFSGLDFDRYPLKGWPPLPRACAALIDWTQRQQTDDESGGQRRISYSGVSDLATQFHVAQESFDDVSRMSSWSVMGWLALLMLVVGPLDYLVVRRLLKRPELTWVTFPAIVLGASLLALAAAREGNGDQLLVNSVDIVDIDTATGAIGSTSWHTVYSPESARYKIESESLADKQSQSLALSSVSTVLTWDGVPETTTGGMYRTGGIDFARPGYTMLVDRTGVENLPIAIWSTKAVRVSQSATIEQPVVEGKLEALASGQLTGSFTHRLPSEITDWILSYGTRVYRPREPLKPGAVFPPDSWERISQRELRGHLTETRMREVQTRENIGPEYLTEQSAYDPLSQDHATIVRMISFHRAAGGSGYTGLNNESLDDLDLSDMVKLKRAVLLGRIKLDTGSLKIDGGPVKSARRETFIRLLIPVQEIDTGPQPLLELSE